MRATFVVLAAVSSLNVSGCASYLPSPYGASIGNVEAIKAANVKPVAVEKFSAAMPGLASITCRGAGPVTVSPSFESYIEKALIDELRLAGAYDQQSAVTLSGRLDSVDFSSGITDGNWTFKLTLSNGRNENFSTTSSLGFSGSFVGATACQQVAQNFGPAVQKLLGDVVRDPQFKKVASATVVPPKADAAPLP